MRILCPIVFSQALLMVAGKPEMLEGSAVGAQLVGRHPGRREALLAEQLAHQLDGRRPVSTALDQDLEDLAFVVDGTPRIHLPWDASRRRRHDARGLQRRPFSFTGSEFRRLRATEFASYPTPVTARISEVRSPRRVADA